MNENIIIRLYRVRFGDCIYVQVPDNGDVFTILIDCGTSSAANTYLLPAVKHIRSQLPTGQDNKPRLDLLVVTHPHADHIKGFDPKWFKDMTIGRIWMTAFMNLNHKQAAGAQAFEKAAFEAAKSLVGRAGLHLSEGAQSLLERSLSLNNTDVLAALRQGIPTLKPRLYVARDIAEKLSDADRAVHQLSLENGISTFRGFRDNNTCIRFLAPEWDIDGTYLGKITTGGTAFTDNLMLRTTAHAVSEGSSDAESPGLNGDENPGTEIREPENVSARDFRLLRSRLLYAALAFSQDDDDLKNNTSMVFLLECGGRRLLFTGDAEWDGKGVNQGQHNSSWDVMLDNPDVKELLLKPLDLFKVAHHGSHNGTPFSEEEGGKILEEMVKPAKTNVVVSTVTGVHGKKNPVPYPPLLTKLGSLALNQQAYQEGEPDLIDVPQPQRTDRQSDSTKPGLDYLEVILTPTQ